MTGHVSENTPYVLTWCWRGSEEVGWSDRVRGEEVLHRVREDRSILYTIKIRLTGLVTSCVGTVS
jgi:hypothetical protein